jgi:restriction system-associated AAA family ATPase
MKLLRAHIIKADTCGGLLDRLDLWLRDPQNPGSRFDPLCLIGPNGSGKSQLLQVIAEMFQSVFHAIAPSEERIESNPNLQFELEYVIRSANSREISHVRVTRKNEGKGKSPLIIQLKVHDEWKVLDSADLSIISLLPTKLVGYTSGDNETLSLPFLLSRSGYADEVYSQAVKETDRETPIQDTRLMLIDYGTHLEVLVANLLLGSDKQRTALLAAARLERLHSFRCVIQLNHSAAPNAPARLKGKTKRKGIQLTNELEEYLDRLQRCATCYDYNDKTETYTLDFLVDSQTRSAFRSFWDTPLDLYSAFHKLAMLNDLVIPKPTRQRFKQATKGRHFAARLPEPQDEEKVFRFETVNFEAVNSQGIVDYVSLSDGEHQLAQLLGTFCMVSFDNVLFLLDEPESHFNPQWRVEFTSKILDLPTAHGTRRHETGPSQQEVLLTTHAPFVPSDMSRERVLIFSKDKETGRIVVRRPQIETFGTTFDAILAECFGVHPPISAEPRQEIDKLMRSEDRSEIREGLKKLGNSVEKVFLADHLRQLPGEEV